MILHTPPVLLQYRTAPWAPRRLAHRRLLEVSFLLRAENAVWCGEPRGEVMPEFGHLLRKRHEIEVALKRSVDLLVVNNSGTDDKDDTEPPAGTLASYWYWLWLDNRYTSSFDGAFFLYKVMSIIQPVVTKWKNKDTA